MLKKSARVVLASLRGSTYRKGMPPSSLAAALLDSLFEHPDAYVDINTLKKDFSGDASNDPSKLARTSLRDGG